jgi:hypothetical protein
MLRVAMKRAEYSIKGVLSLNPKIAVIIVMNRDPNSAKLRIEEKYGRLLIEMSK